MIRKTREKEAGRGGSGRHRLRVELVSGLAIGAMLLAAPGTTASASASTSGGTIAFGVLSCFTGRLASLGEAMLQGSQVAEEAINAHGGVLGDKLALYHADTGCDEADSVPATHQLLAANHVVGIIGPETQEIAAVAPIVTAAQIPTEFQGGSTLFNVNKDPYLWRDSPSDTQLSVAMALYAHRLGYKRAAMLFYNEIAAQTFKAPIVATWKKLGGTVTADVTVAPDQTDYLPEVRQIIKSHPQVIFTQTDAPTAGAIFQNFKELDNLGIPFIGSDVTGGAEYLKAITFPVAHAHLTSVYGTSYTGQGANVWNSLFAQKFGKSAIPLANANYAYDAVVSLALAMDRAGTTSGPAVIKVMKDVTNPPGPACYAYSKCYSLLKA
ncbi:MAG: ABC transporter substrate-binding protein, partial [Acidimicrobiales bacterium]